jgi:aminoglycoside 6'-N-acetyltransferase
VGDFAFRRVERSDFPLLAFWLAQPHVARWWNHEYTPQAIERDFGASIDGDEPNEDHLVLLDGRAIGLIQYSRFADYPEYLVELEPIVAVPPGAVSIDYLIGEPGLVGQGVGTAMIAAFVDRIWAADPFASWIIVPVNSSNEASWRALQRAGFARLARGELEPDNPIDDPMHEIFGLDRPTDRCDRP